MSKRLKGSEHKSLPVLRSKMYIVCGLRITRFVVVIILVVVVVGTTP